MRRTIVSAVDIVIQISRLHDGTRKVMSISEVVGLEGNNVVLEEIFAFKPNKEQNEDGKVKGNYFTSGLMQRSVLRKKHDSLVWKTKYNQHLEPLTQRYSNVLDCNRYWLNFIGLCSW